MIFDKKENFKEEPFVSLISLMVYYNKDDEWQQEHALIS
jgi:hypothetical protein